jgi:hypothetical protein
MGCCGKNRPVRQVENNGSTPVPSTHRTSRAQHFEYTGRTSLTVVGPITGRRYRFTHPGVRLAVDEGDSPSMLGVPNLRRASAPE